MKQFTANRLAGGNRIFPAEIHIDNFGVNLKIPGLFSGQQKSLGFDKISSIEVHSPMIGFSKIIIHTVGWGWDNITAEGFEKADAEEIKELVQIGIQSVRHGHSGGHNGGGGVDMSHHIAQSEAIKAQAEVEKRKLDLEEAKHRAEVEEKEAGQRKVKADVYRQQGRPFIAWLVELNPWYSMAIIAFPLMLCLGPGAIKFVGIISTIVLIVLIIKDAAKIAWKYIAIGVMAIIVLVFGIAFYMKYQNNKQEAKTEENIHNAIQQNQQPVTTNQPVKEEKPVEQAKTTEPNNALPVADTQQHNTQQPVISNTVQPVASNAEQIHNGVVIADKTYFHKEPNPGTIRKGFLIKGQSVTYTKSEGDFIFCTYTTDNGTTTGWLLKADIQ